MIDIGQKLRKAYFTALNGNVLYEGGAVPIVDEKLDTQISEQDVYILMQAQNEQDVPNRCYPITDCDISMRIVSQLAAVGKKEVVENISNQILTLLFPNHNYNSLSIDAPLKIIYAVKTNSEYSPLVQNDRGFIITKTLTIKNRITQ
jgi:hypothetical protein